MPRAWVNVFLTGRDSRSSDMDLLDTILMAVGHRRATITPEPEMSRIRSCISIEVTGHNTASYYSSAEGVVLQWMRDLHHHGHGLPFDHSRIFQKS